MIKLSTDYLRIILFCGGLLMGIQIPAVVDQYAKRIDAHLIEALDVNQAAKQQLLDEVKLMEKNLLYSDFKIKRTLKDKEIITNILNETINSLEEKSEALTIQAKELEEQLRKSGKKEIHSKKIGELLMKISGSSIPKEKIHY